MPYGSYPQTPLGSTTTLAHTEVGEDTTNLKNSRDQRRPPVRPSFTPLASSDTLIHPDEPCLVSNPEKCKDIEALKFNNEKPADLAPSPSEDLYAPPDGGFKAWSTVVGVTLVAFCTFGFANAYGAFSDYYNAVYLTDYSPTLISMIGALQVFVLYICQLKIR
ncbi:hypothetical protein D9757_009696 [Collybiopsis confluens]|uniref:Uncharacterized protein n=1 Tax=Collybiopsis confluens TaxID=2823264 RepID=A0A8H5M1Q5_9AGAR|nr:hypothetical protein D9757_009696 [Collybiopsis confluens]